MLYIGIFGYVISSIIVLTTLLHKAKQSNASMSAATRITWEPWGIWIGFNMVCIGLGFLRYLYTT